MALDLCIYLFALNEIQIKYNSTTISIDVFDVTDNSGFEPPMVMSSIKPIVKGLES